MRLNNRERKLRKKIKDNFLHYAKTCLKIRTKTGAISPFVMNTAQLYIHDLLEMQIKQTGKVRALILKGRQQGCSTYVAARFYWKIIHGRGKRGFILTHLDGATQNVFKIVQRFYQNSPDLVQPSVSKSNAKELIFDKLDSGYGMGTAKSLGVGRSDTIQYFHGSEVAYWAHAKEHISGAVQSVADVKGSEIILESTSDGAQGVFYHMCQDAIKGQGEYQLIFVPWFWQKEYKKKCPKDFGLTKEEEDYKKCHGLDDKQIYWRRLKISELGSLWTFRREYPATVEEAFHSDLPEALWKRDIIDQNRISKQDIPEMKRIVVAIDPAITSSEHSDETGIVVAGLGVDDHGYILADLSGKYTPSEWSRHAIDAYYTYQADRVVAEVNQGGDMVEHTLRTQDDSVSYKAVRASRGKRTRAEPIAAMDERGHIHHVGVHPILEDQMCSFDALSGRASPDRVDARVWALTELMLGKRKSTPMIWRG
jgi:phage terminase large subunit-like protein